MNRSSRFENLPRRSAAATMRSRKASIFRRFFDNLSVPLATHNDIRYAKTILLIGGEPEEEQTFTAKQIRQAVSNGGAKLIVVNDTPIRILRGSRDAVHSC